MCSLECSFLRQSPFYNKVADVQTATLLKKKRLWHRYFPVDFAEFLGTFFVEDLQATAFVSE